MQRNVEQLASTVYDVLIIGGGIYGACVAWDAGLRGLSVALVEKGDFGHATSFNSLKVIHGGLRYLQHLGIRRMRESIHERRVLMRIAPHLIHPLPFLMPTYGHFLQGKESMAFALVLNDLIGFDRNRLQDPEKYLPRGQVISKAACLQLIPGIHEEGLTGGAIWYDCQMYNSERLSLSFLKGSVEFGAHVANYVEVTGFITKWDQVIGVKARDHLTGNDLKIRARIMVNTCGPWVNHIIRMFDNRYTLPKIFFSKAMNIAIGRLQLPEYAIGIASKKRYKDNKAFFHKGKRLFFIVPWRHYSLIGTTHVSFQDEPERFTITEKEIEDFLTEINEAYPAVKLTREDVRFVYSGLLPMHEPNGQTGDVSLVKRFRLYDHQYEDGIAGLLSILGVKYTEARHVAEKVVDLVCAKLGRKSRPSQTACTPVYGGNIERFRAFLRQEITRKPYGLSAETVKHLIYTHGSEYLRIVNYLHENIELGEAISVETQVLKAEVLYAIREEMALKLVDVVFRRTELGLHSTLTDQALHLCVSIMAKELGWDRARADQEVKETKLTLLRQRVSTYNTV
jgi:glycerol-3-phosphate dehydrogenase